MKHRIILATLYLLAWIAPVTNGQTGCYNTDGETIPRSNVAGKKLIRVARELRKLVDPSMAQANLPEKVKFWQQTGFDGLVFNIASHRNPDAPESVHGQWWGMTPHRYEDFVPEIKAFQSVQDWGRLKDNFLWSSMSVWGPGPCQDWFDDEGWKVRLANVRLQGKVAKECGFKGILLDTEQYDQHGRGPWYYPFNYKHYANTGYKSGTEKTPHSFSECVEKVRERGKQYAQAITEEFPDLTLFVIAGLYDQTWHGAWRSHKSGVTLIELDDSLYPAFVDGLLLGLDERASIVIGTEDTYSDSQYKDMLVARDAAKEQGIILSKYPELARKRITFSAGIWTDSGWGKDRWSATDASLNQRDPERHKHVIHNALAVSDKYAWSYGGMSQFLATSPTPLMREYWQADIDSHKPQDLSWTPVPKWDMTDYTDHDAKMAKADAAFWQEAKTGGWKVVVALPDYWHFHFDEEQLLRSRSFWVKNASFDHDAWPLLSVLKCWQSQGTKANGIGIYRMRFDVPANLDPANQEIALAFGGFPPDNVKETGWMDIALNGKGYRMGHLIDVTESIKPGQSNVLAVRVVNKSGPAGLTGHVMLLVRGGNTVGFEPVTVDTPVVATPPADCGQPATGKSTILFSEDFEQYADGTMLSDAGWTSVRQDTKITADTKFGGATKAVDGKTPTGNEALLYKNCQPNQRRRHSYPLCQALSWLRRLTCRGGNALPRR